jgi:hypothetical protein
MELATLAAQIEWVDKRQQERHRDLAERLQRIEEQVRATNGRVTRHDERIETLFRSLKALPRHVITQTQLWRYLIVAGSCISGTYGVLHLLGLIR